MFLTLLLVELRRSRKLLVLALVIGVGGALALACAGDRISIFRWVVAGLGVVLCLAFLVRELRPFRFAITEQGLDVKSRAITRLIPWTEADAVLLVQPPRPAGSSTVPAPKVLIVPVTGSELAQGATEQSPLDGRPARLLLETDDVREPADEIATALTRFGGSRFTDTRTLTAVAPPSGTDFTVVLRGYDRIAVDQLLSDTQQVLQSDDPQQRELARTRIAQANPVVVLRGYDRGQVDAHLRRLSDQL